MIHSFLVPSNGKWASGLSGSPHERWSDGEWGRKESENDQRV